MCVLVQATNQLPKPQTHSAAPFVSLCHKPTTLVSSCKPWHTPTAQCHSCLAQATHQPHSTSIYVLVQATSQLCSTIYVSSLQCPPLHHPSLQQPSLFKKKQVGSLCVGYWSIPTQDSSSLSATITCVNYPCTPFCIHASTMSLCNECHHSSLLQTTIGGPIGTQQFLQQHPSILIHYWHPQAPSTSMHKATYVTACKAK